MNWKKKKLNVNTKYCDNIESYSQAASAFIRGGLLEYVMSYVEYGYIVDAISGVIVLYLFRSHRRVAWINGRVGSRATF